jgi:Secretory lipase
MLSLRSCETLLSGVVIALVLSSCSDNTEPLASGEGPSGVGQGSHDGGAAQDPDPSGSGSGAGWTPVSGDAGSRSDGGSESSPRDASGDGSSQAPWTPTTDGGAGTGDYAFPTDDTPPSKDPFYKPPALIGRPGDVIRSRTSPFVDVTGPVQGSTARQVLYQSTDALGKPMAVSGTVFLPMKPWMGAGSRPLITYAVGTRGLGDACAPSYTLSHGADYEGGVIMSLLDRGWAVAVTDYQGSGTPGLHTYMVGPAEGHAVLDMARAAQQLLSAELPKATPIGIMGYSQGGGSAGWAAELAPTYATELNVKGVAMGGVPGDLAATAEFLDGSPFVAFALMAALGLNAAYPELKLETYLNDRGRELVASGETACLASIDGIGTVGGTTLSRLDDYVTMNPLHTPAWQERLMEVKLGQRKPSVPVFQYHAFLDEIVPFQQAADLRRTYCDKGIDVTWSVLPVEHALGITFGPPLAADWLAHRFAGEPTASNCKDP